MEGEMDYVNLMENYRDQMIKALQEAVRQPSVLGEAASLGGKLCPFGIDVEKCHEWTLELGRDLGFATKNVDGYGGHIMFGSGDANAETFAVAAHIDVVPAGEGWIHDPFGGEMEDGYIYGRGTTDDKGPLLASLFAMKALKDSGLEPKKNIKLIIGCDEETGCSGMDVYLEREGMPDEGFTPDGEFPLVQGEKGILGIDIAKKLHRKNTETGLTVTKLMAGDAPNVVPRVAKCTLRSKDKAEYDRIAELAAAYSQQTGYDLKTKKTGTSLILEATGIAAHGAMPEKGLNAISIMMEFLNRLDFESDEIMDFISFYNEHIGFDLHGERLGCGFEDEVSGKLILNVGLAEINENLASINICMRYPVTCDSEDINAGILSLLEGTDIGLVINSDAKPIYLPLESELVQGMLSAYREISGDESTAPKVIAGGTYAKCFKNMLCFGGMFPGVEDRMHQVEERIAVDDYMRMSAIYAAALHKLCF